MKSLLSRVFSISSSKFAPARQPRRTRLEVENLETRLVPASFRGAVIDFTGGQITKAQMAEGGWKNDAAQNVTSFASLFNASRPWLNLNGDGVVDQADANIAIARIMAKIRHDFAPYNFNIVQGEHHISHPALRNEIKGDAIVMVTGGGFFRTDSQPFGIAPTADYGNQKDEIVWTFGGTQAANGVIGNNADRFINSIAHTTSHEIGHAVGLEHVFIDRNNDAMTHFMMGVPGADGIEGRDFGRDFTFQDISYRTESGKMQNSHQYLQTVLGVNSTTGSLAILKPGELTIMGTNYDDSIRVTRALNGQLQVTINNKTTFLSVNSVDVNSLNAFDAPLTRIIIDARGGNDTVTITPHISLSSVIFGGEGNDTITGGFGRDVILGGSGWDKIWGGADNDILKGGNGRDELYGGAGDDELNGGYDTFADYLVGGADSDTFVKHLKWTGTVWAEEYEGTDFVAGVDKKLYMRYGAPKKATNQKFTTNTGVLSAS